MKQSKFNTGDIVKYNGNVYKITNIVWLGNNESYAYDVECIKNNFPEDPAATGIGAGAESLMEEVEFYFPTDRDKWMKRALEYMDKLYNAWKINLSDIDEFKKWMEEDKDEG